MAKKEHGLRTTIAPDRTATADIATAFDVVVPATRPDPKLEKPENDRYKLKRLSINMPQYVFDEIQALSKKSHQPMGILMRNAYALAQLYYDESEEGNSMAIIDTDGRVIKDVFLP